jgi:hypothetical protein
MLEQANCFSRPCVRARSLSLLTSHRSSLQAFQFDTLMPENKGAPAGEDGFSTLKFRYESVLHGITDHRRLAQMALM